MAQTDHICISRAPFGAKNEAHMNDVKEVKEDRVSSK